MEIEPLIKDENDIEKLYAPHSGIDFVTNSREVVSVKNGEVIFAGVHPQGKNVATGTLIIIKYNDGNYGLYGHLDPNDLHVKAGDVVVAGNNLGTYFNGKMGLSTGGHLHYGEYKLSTDKQRDEFLSLNEFVMFFNASGYFNGLESVPDDKKIPHKNGKMISVKPMF